MEKQLAYSILDNILTEIKEDAGHLNKRFLIHKLEQRQIYLSDKILVEGLLRLQDDGYIRIESHIDKMLQSQPLVNYYFSTIKGDTFEGYIQMEINKHAQAALAEKLQKDIFELQRITASNSTSMNQLTRHLIYAAYLAVISSFAVLFWYMWSFNHPHN